jgi:hypothetical protein
MTYPDGIDALVNVNANDTLAAGGHAARHNSVNTALEELADVLTVPATNTLALVPDGTTERFRIDSAGLITGAGTSLGAWTAYTPTLGGTGWALGNGTLGFFYCQIGKIVMVRGIITFGSTSTFGGAALTVSLPVTGRTGQMVNYPGITCAARDVSATQRFQMFPVFNNTTTITMQCLSSAAGLTVAVTSTAPFTWESGDVIQIIAIYEAA